MELTIESTIVAAKDQLSSDLGGETVILSLGAGTYFGLDDVGTRVWTLIKQPRTVREICGQLLEEYDVGPAHCEKAVLDLLQKMAAAGLISVSPA